MAEVAPVAVVDDTEDDGVGSETGAQGGGGATAAAAFAEFLRTGGKA